MNQVLKDAVYCTGTIEQLEFMATTGGMNEEEREIFKMLHRDVADEIIQSQMGMSRKVYDRVVGQIRRKILVAVYHCIDYTMDNE